MNSPQSTSLSKKLDSHLSASLDAILNPHSAHYRGPNRPGFSISVPTENNTPSGDLRTTLQQKRKRPSDDGCFRPSNSLDSSPSLIHKQHPSHHPSSPPFSRNRHHHLSCSSSSRRYYPSSTAAEENRRRESPRLDDDETTTVVRDEIQCFDEELTPATQPKHTPLRNARKKSPEKIVVTSEDDAEETKEKSGSKTKKSDSQTFKRPDAKASYRPGDNHFESNSNSGGGANPTNRKFFERLGQRIRPSQRKYIPPLTYASSSVSRNTYSRINGMASQSAEARPKMAHGRFSTLDAERECEFDTIRPAKTNTTAGRNSTNVKEKIIDKMQRKGGNQTRLPNPQRKEIQIEDLSEPMKTPFPDTPTSSRIAKQSVALHDKTDECAGSQFSTPISIPAVDQTSGSQTSPHLARGTSPSRRMSEGQHPFGHFPTLEVKKLFFNKTYIEQEMTSKIELVLTPGATFKIKQGKELAKMEWSQIHAFKWYDIAKVTSDPVIVISADMRDRRESDKGYNNSRKISYYMVPASCADLKIFLQAVREKDESRDRRISFSVLTDEEVANLPDIEHIVSLKIPSSRSAQGRRASEKDTQFSGTGMVTRSKRRAVGPKHDLDVALFSYPFGGRGSVSITNSDLGRLNDNEFLNDNLIEWYLKFIQNGLQEKNPDLAGSVHFFNSFFYKRLTEKEKSRTIAYESVMKWTNKVDLFDKQYIFIPINENLHWYLALIYNPGLLLKPSDSKDQKEDSPEVIAESDVSTPGTPVSAKSSSFSDVRDISMWRTLKTPEINGKDAVTPIGKYSLEVNSIALAITDTAHEGKGFTDAAVVVGDASRNDADVIDMEVDKPEEIAEVIIEETTRDFVQPEAKRSAATSKGKGKNKERVRPSDKTWIVIFDSLNNKQSNAVRRNLLEYLSAEALSKKSTDITLLLKERLKMVYAKVPGQSNFCDCGVYLLHYAETFLTDPETYLDKIVNHEEDKQAWLYTTVKKRREKMRELAEKLADEYEEWQTKKAKELSLQELQGT